MFFLKKTINKFGLSNTLSVISFFISITCFAFVARISQQYSKIELNKTDPKIIIANHEAVKVVVDKTNDVIDSSMYDTIINNIDTSDFDKNNNTAKTEKRTPEEQVEKKSKPDQAPLSVKKIEDDIRESKNNKIKDLQLGTFKSHREAVLGWFKMADKYSYLNGFRYNVDTQKLDNNDYVYILKVKTKDNNEANKLLEKLKSNNVEASLVE